MVAQRIKRSEEIGVRLGLEAEEEELARRELVYFFICEKDGEKRVKRSESAKLRKMTKLWKRRSRVAAHSRRPRTCV